MNILDQHRYFLTMLIWALILELIVIAYYITASLYNRFEFVLTLFLLLLTLAGISAIIIKIRKEL